MNDNENISECDEEIITLMKTDQTEDSCDSDTSANTKNSLQENDVDLTSDQESGKTGTENVDGTKDSVNHTNETCQKNESSTSTDEEAVITRDEQFFETFDYPDNDLSEEKTEEFELPLK